MRTPGPKRPRRGWECACRSRPLARPNERRIYTIGENKGRSGLLCQTRKSGGVIPLTSLVEFDADQVFGSPYHSAPAPQAISNDQKGKLRRDAQWADHLQRRPSRGLVTNETGDRAPVELDASRLQSASVQLGKSSSRK